LTDAIAPSPAGAPPLAGAETSVGAETPAPPPAWVEVLVDCPGVQGLYTYELPSGFSALEIPPGAILSVPFGSRQLGAIAIRLLSSLPPDLDPNRLKRVESVVDQGCFDPSYWQLLECTATYYQTPLIQVIRAALPPGLLAKSQRRVRLKPTAGANPALLSPDAQHLLTLLRRRSDYTWQYLARQCPQGRAALNQLQAQGQIEVYLSTPRPPQPQQRQAVILAAAAPSLELTARQQEILTSLQRQGGDLWLTDALQTCRTTTKTLKALAAKGCLTLESREVLRLGDQTTQAADRPKVLTPDQQIALDHLHRLQHSATVLLHGVTGSGKTEVYLQAIAPRLQAGQSALVLVPEIGLTPQLTDRFRQRFGQRVRVYHSSLSDGERYDTWRQLLSGEPQVIIGTRSAVFLPVPHLGLIVLDEEHDSSFKQDQPAPTYHARRVAQWRSQLQDCPLVLGSATPALESWQAAGQASPAVGDLEDDGEIPSDGEKQGAIADYLALPKRVEDRPHPPIDVVDMRQELKAGHKSIFSRRLKQALTAMQEAGGQGILFIHRRGHSRFVSCRSCGHVMECPHCDVSLAYHQPHENANPTLRCHYCGYGQVHPPNCPACGSPYLKHFGSGTQRVEQALAREFPDLRCLRFDSDTTRTKGSHRALLARFAQGEADLLVGTQMITKGIDLPQVTLVGIVAADGLLYMADYWAGERAFQILTQVAGRAGRGDQLGQVILQTYTPDHPVVEAVQRQDYATFATEELAARRDLAYPPYGRLVLLRFSSPDPVAVEQTAIRVGEAAQALLADRGQVLGPVPAPILRVAQRFRWHLLLKFPLTTPLPDLNGLRSHCLPLVSLSLDIDPLNLS
jgi:primosomal protein N' (replication factor Y)